MIKREPEPFLSEVLDGCSDEIDSIIDYQKPVVCLGECPDRYRRILRVVLVDVFSSPKPVHEMTPFFVDGWGRRWILFESDSFSFCLFLCIFGLHPRD